jgi:hypothetical protein
MDKLPDELHIRILEMATIESKPILLNKVILPDYPDWEHLTEGDEVFMNPVNSASINIPRDIMLVCKKWEREARRIYFTKNQFILVITKIEQLRRLSWSAPCGFNGDAINYRLLKLRDDRAKFQAQDTASNLEIKIVSGYEHELILRDLGFREPSITISINEDLDFDNGTVKVCNETLKKLLHRAFSTGFKHSRTRAGRWPATPYHDFFDDGEVYALIGGGENSEVYTTLFSDCIHPGHSDELGSDAGEDDPRGEDDA